MKVSELKVWRAGQDNGLGVMYRVDADWRAGYDPYDDDGWKTLPATLEGFTARAFTVTRVTPKGKWIDAHGERKFILNDARKRYACETLELAVESFKARKRRQIALLAAQLRRAEAELARINAPGLTVFELGGFKAIPGGQPSPLLEAAA
jgi:hypothetical protein